MGANEIQIFVIKTVKNLGENCACCVKKYTFHYCLMFFACVLLYKLFPSVFIIVDFVVYSSPVVGFAFLVRRVFIRMERPKVKSLGAKSKRWKELQSRRRFKSLHHVHVRKQHNKNSFMQDPPSVRQNAKETSNKHYNNMSAKDNKDVVFPTNNLVDKNPKEMHHNRFDEEYRKSSFDNNDKDKTKESLDVDEEKEKQDEHRIKTVRWFDEAEKSLMDLGISEDERSKRLESLMERRRSKKLSSFQVRRTGIGNTSCGQLSSLNIPKKNPFLSDNSASPVSAPSYMVKSNPFDLPYDPHEEKPILTGDTFEDEFRATHHKDSRHGPSRLGSFAPPKFTNYKYKTSFQTDFSIKQLPSGKLVTSTVENKEDDNKQDKRDDVSNPNHCTNDNHAKEENKEAAKKQPQQDDSKVAEKVFDNPDEANRISKNTKEKEIEHEKISIDDSSTSSSSSSSSCSEDEKRMMRPNKEAILHSLSMSRMRSVSLSLSQGKSFHRHAETFDCGPSSLFDKSKTDCFFFGGNKKIHYASMNSIASDMQVEVSEVGSPTSTSLLNENLVDSVNSFDLDLNDVRLSDVDDFSDQSSVESDFSRTNHDSNEKTDSYTKIEERCTFEKL
ncbi:hypothetical protein Lser_V15G26662 [Lactuca serriola]